MKSIKKAGLAILTSDKRDCKIKNNNNNNNNERQQCTFYIDKGAIHEEDIRLTNVYVI